MKKISKFRFLTLCLTLALLVSAIPASAATIANAETPDTTQDDLLVIGESNIDTLTPIEETTLTREEALAVLGLTPEEAEAEGLSLYVVDAQSASEVAAASDQVTINSGDVYSFPTFTFSGRNIGRYWTCNGTRLIFGCIHHSSAEPDTLVSVLLYQYGRDYTNIADCNMIMYCPARQTTSLSEFMDAYRTDYNFVYYGGNESRLTMVVAVAG